MNNKTAIRSACCVIFFLSGASALIYEVLWFRLAGPGFGNSIRAPQTESKESSAHALHLYLLCVTGRREEANRLVCEIISLFPKNEGYIRFLGWLHDSFGLDMPDAYTH